MRKGVELRGDEKLAANRFILNEATEEDWYKEFLAPILAVKLVRECKRSYWAY